MSIDKNARQAVSEPRTLWEVHQAVMAVRPARGASSAQRRSFRAYAVKAYSKVADVDVSHRDEALYWADYERTHVDRIDERNRSIAAGGDVR